MAVLLGGVALAAGFGLLVVWLVDRAITRGCRLPPR